MTENAATMPPLGKVLTADEVARFVARVAYPTSPVVLVDEELALVAPARAYGDWRGAGSAGPGGEGAHASARVRRRPRRG